LRGIITNPELIETIRFLKVKARENKVKIWNTTAEFLSKPRARRAELNLNHISRASQPNALVVVPGKVLSEGHIKHPVTLGAFQFSRTARMKIEQAGGTDTAHERAANA
jgi:large subunit ribosomal protein L18e